MQGMNNSTGAALSQREHLAQSIADILTTPLGSRLMRRDYGSLLPRLIDQPFNGGTRLQLYAATAIALMRWEPRIRLTRVQLSDASMAGAVVLDLEGTVIDTNQPTSLSIPLALGGIV